MNRVRLRHAVRVNPGAPLFDRLSLDDELTFLPMEAIWADARLDLSRVRPKAAASTGYTRFQNGDVLVPKITPTFEAGRSVLIDGLRNKAGAGTTELHVLRPGPSIDPRFLTYITQGPSFLKLGEAEMYGVAGQKRVPDDFIRDFEVTLMELSEQRRVADFLDAETRILDRMRELKTELLRRLTQRMDALRDGILGELQSRLGELPLRRLVLSIEQGASPVCEATPARSEEWGVLKLSSIKRGAFYPEENKRLMEGQVLRRYEVRSGDLLVTRANTPQLVGDVAVVDGHVRGKLLPDLIYRVNLTDGVNAGFIAQVLLGGRVRGLIEATARGSSQSMVKLRGEDIRSWPIPRAGSKEQLIAVHRITDSGDYIEKAKAAIKQQLRLLSERRQALITAAVTGQIDVTTARGVD